MTIPQFEFFSDRQIQKALDSAKSLLKVTPTLIILLVIWGVFFISPMIYRHSREQQSRDCEKIGDWARFVRTRKFSACFIYSLTILQFCVLNREKQSSSQIVLSLTKYVENGWFHESLVLASLLDLCIFIPFGMLLYRAFQKGRVSLLLVVLAGFFVELMQYVAKGGTFKLVDLTMYTLGGFFGILLERVIQHVLRRRRLRHEKSGDRE